MQPRLVEQLGKGPGGVTDFAGPPGAVHQDTVTPPIRLIPSELDGPKRWVAWLIPPRVRDSLASPDPPLRDQR